MARPPLQAARQYASEQLTKLYVAEYDSLVSKYLAEHGWRQEEVTRQKWVQQPAKSDG